MEIDWNAVASELGITNGHAARMRYSRFKMQMEGKPPAPRKPRSAAPRNKKPKPQKLSKPEAKDEGPSPVKAETEQMDGVEPAVKTEPVIKAEPGLEHMGIIPEQSNIGYDGPSYQKSYEPRASLIRNGVADMTTTPNLFQEQVSSAYGGHIHQLSAEPSLCMTQEGTNTAKSPPIIKTEPVVKMEPPWEN